MKKKIIAILMSAAMLTSVPAFTSSAATAFSDVPAGAWYAQDVSEVQAYGIINGKSAGIFDPSGTLTVAEAITMAARTHACEEGETIPVIKDDAHWYAGAVSYATERGVITDPASADCEWLDLAETYAGTQGVYDTSDYNAVMNSRCSRQLMALFFSGALLEGGYAQINSGFTLPDVVNDTSSEYIYKLYQAGILTGSDEYGTFHPDSTITRAEAAAIINRVNNPARRRTFTLKKDNATELLTHISMYIAGNKSGAGVMEFMPGDYDLDGSWEAFALVGNESGDEGMISGTLYFVNSEVVDTVVAGEDFCLYDQPVLDFGTEKLYTVGKFYETGDTSYIFGVRDGKWYEDPLSGCGMSVMQIPGTSDITIIDEDYDMTFDPDSGTLTGHTYKPYYFCRENGAFSEYTGRAMTAAELEKYDGGNDLLAGIKAAGGTVSGIFFRGNGIININYYINDEDTGMQLRCNATVQANDDGSVTLISGNGYGTDDLEQSDYGGSYKASFFD